MTKTVEYKCKRGHRYIVRVTKANPNADRYVGTNCGYCLMDHVEIAPLRRVSKAVAS